MNLVERSSQTKNKVFEALEKDPALLMLTGPENIYELAVQKVWKANLTLWFKN
nr:hypothetical protein [Bacillus amyloliquefaciens]